MLYAEISENKDTVFINDSNCCGNELIAELDYFSALRFRNTLDAVLDKLKKIREGEYEIDKR